MVIPTLNEEPVVGGLLERLRRTAGVEEVVVADGGSTDGTTGVVARHAPFARAIRGERGRGAQLRMGAAEATGDVLLFLHADVVPPEDVVFQVRRAIEAGCVGGNFRLRYPEGGRLGRWLERLAPFYRRLGRYYGDSGVFVRRDVYAACGGMPFIPIMEDIVFARRLEGAGRTCYLPGPMVSAARRWEGRPLRTLLLWVSMQTAFALGASPWRLVRFYAAAKEG